MQISTLLAYRKSLIECVTGQRRVTEADVARVTSPHPSLRATLSHWARGKTLYIKFDG